LVGQFQEEFPELANWAVSRVPDRKLREECVREVRGGSRQGQFKSRVVRGVLKAFLRWYDRKEGEQIVFRADDGTELEVDAPNSYADDYGRKWYGRLKDTERALVYDAPAPHTAMLSLTASTTDESGKPRPPGDHLKGLQEAWTNHTRKALQRALEDAGFAERYDPAKHADCGPVGSDVRSGMKMVCGDGEPAKWWDYLTVVEPHGGGGGATGYAHFHVAVVTSHPVEEATLRRAVDKHVQRCEFAGPAAHGDGAVSISAVDPDADPEDADGVEDIGNLGSYLSEYIGGFAGDIEDRPLYELMFQAVTWATNTKRVRRSQGAVRLAERGRRVRDEFEDAPPVPDYDADMREWEVLAIADGDGERRPPSQKGTSFMVSILTGGSGAAGQGGPTARGQPPPVKS
jgi:hypothetical protein